MGHGDFAALRSVLDKLDERVDTIADLITAESVHQLVQGNAVRAGGALDIARTGNVPDAFEVIRTPRLGYDVNHRVVIAIDPTLPPAWSAVEASAAASADPVLNSWASHLLPDPATVQISVHRVDPVTDAAGEALLFTAADLGLPPLGWVQLAVDPAEIYQRIAHVARQRWGPTAATGRVLIEAAGGPPPQRTLADLLTVGAAVQQLLSHVRGSTAADLVPAAADPATTPASVAQTAAARVSAVESQLKSVIDGLNASAAAADADALVAALFAASALGEATATPKLDADTPTLSVLLAQAAAVLPILAKRLAGTGFVSDPNDVPGTLDRARDRLALLCGWRLPVTWPAPAPATGPLRAAAAQTQLVGAEPVAVRRWLQLHAAVRPAVDALLAVYDLAETLDTGARLDVRAQQVSTVDPPPTSNPRWVGVDPRPPNGTTGFVLQGLFANGSDMVNGLTVDNWNQVIPAETHQTGLAFHYDEPDSTAPQALLVAVPPDLSPNRQPANWDLGTLLDVVTTTLALSRDRAVAATDAQISGITILETS